MLQVDRSGSVVLESLLRGTNPDTPSPGRIGFKEAVAVGAWYIWWQRREVVKGESVASPPQSAFAVLAITANYQGAKPNKEPRVVQWVKPFTDMYKLNIDASFYPNGTGAAGAVLRNSKGEAIAGGGWPLCNITDATTAEARALHLGLTMLDNLDLAKVTVETDSMEICQAYNGDTEILGPYTSVLADCFIISSRIGAITVQHCNREANRVAHNLAREAYVSDRFFSWDGDPPSFIIPDVTLFELYGLASF